ncbi:MAG TPA: H-X9-DG-CTERM domain-containing protein, partial [Verrucomicrobiae bacterium]|nr:H-X9-DG-CTERM domain-containing protein [Verrucomicrobiae bacterium]
QMAATGPFAKIIDIPASYHNGACGFAFADGHAEIHKWVGSMIKTFPLNWSSGVNVGNTSRAANDSWPDVAWLQQRTSY